MVLCLLFFCVGGVYIFVFIRLAPLAFATFDKTESPERHERKEDGLLATEPCRFSEDIPHFQRELSDVFR